MLNRKEIEKQTNSIKCFQAYICVFRPFLVVSLFLEKLL